jgi:hypothetical protein
MVADEYGASEPFGHGEFSLEGIVVDDLMMKEFHDVVVAELLFIDIYPGCCDSTHEES